MDRIDSELGDAWRLFNRDDTRLCVAYPFGIACYEIKAGIAYHAGVVGTLGDVGRFLTYRRPRRLMKIYPGGSDAEE